MSILVRKLAFCLISWIVLSTSAYATDIYWSDGASRAGSPGEECTNAGQNQYAGAQFQVFSNAVVTNISDSYATCTFYFTWNSASGVDDTTLVRTGPSTTLTRGGSTCPNGTGPYNPLTGACSVTVTQKLGDVCSDQTGSKTGSPMIWDGAACVQFADSTGDAPCAYIAAGATSAGSKYQVTGVLDSTGNAVAPPEFADTALKCAITTISTSDCTINVAGDIKCNVVGKISDHANPSGTVNAADALCTAAKPCPAKQPLTETASQPCVPISNGSGGTACTEVKSTTAEGEQQCGLVNGAYQCVTKQPTSNTLTSNVTATSQTLTDGSVQVTTVKDSSLVDCTDVKTCTTVSSSTTQHSTTSPSGTTKTDTSCKGTCTVAGGGVETIPTAGTGTGATGSCTGDKCGNGSSGTAATTQDCAVTPPCNGDPFSCAILQQEHIDTCKLMALPTSSDQAAMDAKVSKSQSDLDAAQLGLDSQASSLLVAFQLSTSGGALGGGKCLPDVPFSVMGHSMSIEFSKACDSLAFVRLAMMAVAYLIAAKIVIREV